MRISHIWVHEIYDLISSPRSQIYDKDKHKKVKAIIFNIFKMYSNTFLFDSDKPKICHKLRMRTYK